MTIVTVPITTGAQILGADPQRISIIIGPGLTERITVSSEGIPALGAGYNIEECGHPLVLDVFTHGQAVTKAWFGIADTAAQTIAIVTAGEPDGW